MGRESDSHFYQRPPRAMIGPTDTRPAASREAAYAEARAAEQRLRYGRMVLIIEKVGGVVIDHNVQIENFTHDDISRIMRQRPRPVGKGERP